MKYYDYDWDINSERIVLDRELNIDKLGWQHGDCFKLTNINGKAMLVKVDPLVGLMRDIAEDIKNEKVKI